MRLNVKCAIDEGNFNNKMMGLDHRWQLDALYLHPRKERGPILQEPLDPGSLFLL